MLGVKGSTLNAMSLHKEVDIVDSPMFLNGNTMMLPYYKDPQEFIKICQVHPEFKTLICHQEFNGANLGGMYSKEGVDPAQIPQTRVISGHIHNRQEFGKVFYPGSPRWRTMSDANQAKSVYLIDANSGEVLQEYPTNPKCRKIVVLTQKEGEIRKDHPLNPNEETIIELYGSAKFCETEAEVWKSKGVKVKVFLDQVGAATIKESDGLAESFDKYVKVFKPPKQSQKEALWALSKERINWIP
jgi:DNA repair exonuclease SbcCD nuclease subunit